MADEQPPRPGYRKDGQPYKAGNTRPDGSYGVGKGRTSEKTRFASGDGRPRGRRPNGGRNLANDWHDELNEKITVTENGKPKRHTKQRGIIKQVTSRALKGNDRAAEIALRHAGFEPGRPKTLSLSDEQIFSDWLRQRLGDGSLPLPANNPGDSETSDD